MTTFRQIKPTPNTLKDSRQPIFSPKAESSHATLRRKSHQIELYDKRRVSIHEAGHAVVSIVLGARSVGAQISRTEDPSPDERTLAGYAKFCSLGLTKIERSSIGIAGEMANWYSTLDSDDRVGWKPLCWDFIEEVEDDELLSPTDYEMISKLWDRQRYKITTTAGEVLSTNWRAIESTASWLASNEFIFDEQIRMLVMNPNANLEEAAFETLPRWPVGSRSRNRLTRPKCPTDQSVGVPPKDT